MILSLFLQRAKYGDNLEEIDSALVSKYNLTPVVFIFCGMCRVSALLRAQLLFLVISLEVLVVAVTGDPGTDLALSCSRSWRNWRNCTQLESSNIFVSFQLTRADRKFLFYYRVSNAISMTNDRIGSK